MSRQGLRALSIFMGYKSNDFQPQDHQPLDYSPVDLLPFPSLIAVFFCELKALANRTKDCETINEMDHLVLDK